MELIRMSIKDDNGQVSNELKIAVGAMEIADKVVEDVMTRLAVSVIQDIHFAGLYNDTLHTSYELFRREND